MLTGNKSGGFVTLFLGLALAVFPQTSLAQTVPVKDDILIAAFKAYATTFTKYAEKTGTQLEDLKEMIAGENESGKLCSFRTIEPDATAYDEGPWANVSASSSIPTTISVDEHTGDSVRCLLKEVVEWQKLGLSIQIHSMLKTYIADAQAKQLNNQLYGKISAAKLRWASQGNQVVSKGGNSKTPVYETNAVQSINDEKRRRLEHLTAQATDDPDVDSFGVCRSWRFEVAANAVENSLQETEDPIQKGPERMKCGDANDGDDFGSFSQSFNAPGVGGMEAFMHLLNNPTASPLGATSLMDAEAANALALQEEATKFRKSTTGADADVECSGLPGDPFCLSTLGTAVTPQFQNQNAVSGAAEAGDQMVLTADGLDQGAGSEHEIMSTTLNTGPGGLLGYDETGLLDQGTAVNSLVREFYDVIGIGYYSINDDTELWAKATMLMIYDEMKFDPESPNVVVTDGTDEEPVDPYDE